MNKWQLLKRNDLDSYQKLMIMVLMGEFLNSKRWWELVGEKIIKETQLKPDWRKEIQYYVEGIPTPQETGVLYLRYGLKDGKSRTFEEVGREFCLTRERIRQIEARALWKLRHPANRLLRSEN